MDVISKAVDRRDNAIRRAQEAVVAAESELLVAVHSRLNSMQCSDRELARRLGFSAGYMCDIRHCRRRISHEFLERLRRLKVK